MISELVTNIKLEKAFMLTSKGDILVYSTAVNPAKFESEWKFNSSIFNLVCNEKLECFAGLSLGQTSDSKAEFDCLIGGTLSGQIVVHHPSHLSKQDFLVQAHGGKINHLFVNYHNNHALVVTSSNDGYIKIWSIELVDKLVPGAKVLNLGSSTASVSINLKSAVEVPTSFGIPMIVKYDPIVKRIMVTTQKSKLLLFRGSMDEKNNLQLTLEKNHPEDDDHSGGVKCISYTASLGLVASTGGDGLLKIWDMASNTLVREMQFDMSLHSVIFLNQKLDLAVSLGDEIVFVNVHDYLPLQYFKRLMSMDIIDDLDEKSISFDVEKEFWVPESSNIDDSSTQVDLWDVL